MAMGSKMKYLFIDGSENSTFLQAGKTGKFVHSTVDTKRNLCAKITELTDDILKKAGLKPDELELFALCLGPGSLTGLRVAAGFLRTLAFVNKKPLLGIDLFSWSLETLKNSGVEGKVRLLVPALIDKAFAFEADLPEIPEIIQPCLLNTRSPADDCKNIAIRWQNSGTDTISPSPEALHNMIQTNGKIRSYDFDKVLEILPMYVIPSQAERKLKVKSC